MTSIGNGWLRRSLLISIYALGVFGILASGDGDGDGSRAFSCGLSVRGIAPVGDGTVWVGVFAKTNTNTEDRVVLLDTDGSDLLSVFIGDGGSENAVRAVARDALGNIYVGGDFNGGILRLRADGSLDPAFDQVGTGFNGRVTSIAPLANGQVYVGGFFSIYDGDIVSGLVRLNADGSWDNAGFVATGVTNVESVALASDGTTDLYSGGLLPLRLERWDSNGFPIINFDPTFDDSVLIVEPIPAPMGDIYVGGSFTDRLVRLNSNDTVDNGFDVGTGFDDDVLSIEIAADMTTDVYVGGSFTGYKGNAANGIIRLDEIGSPNANFIIGSGFTDPDGLFPSSLVASVVQDTNVSPNVLDVFVGGGFTQYNGTASNGIVRLDPDGSLDTAFDVSVTVDGGICDSQTIPD
jgi:hypothetical protein